MREEREYTSSSLKQKGLLLEWIGVFIMIQNLQIFMLEIPLIFLQPEQPKLIELLNIEYKNQWGALLQNVDM